MEQNKGFSAKECQAVMKYLYLKANSAKKHYDDMSVTLGDKRPSYSTVKNVVVRFKRGYLSTEGDRRSGRPTQQTAAGNVDTIDSMILDDGRISLDHLNKGNF
jgi:hypothetical protein